MNREEILIITRYLASVLAAAVKGEEIPEKPDSLSWEAVFSLAARHSLAGAAFYATDKLLRNEISPELYAKLQKQYTLELVKNMKQTEEFKKLTSLFAESKIRFLPLKGFLMKVLYPRPELRTMSDLDILIDQKDATRVKNLLTSNGYAFIPDNELGVHDSYEKPPFMHVEMHNQLYRGSKYSMANAIEKSDSPYWYLMTDADFFVFMLVHSKSHYEDGGCGIRAVLDHYLYTRKNAELVNSEQMRKRLKKEKLTEFFEMMNTLCALWFDGIVPESDISEVEVYTASGGVYGTLENQTYFAVKKKGKLGHVMSRLFPKPIRIRRRYRWVNKCIILLPIGYIVRIVQSIFNGRVKECAELISESDKLDEKYRVNKEAD